MIIELRHDTAANWIAANPTLNKGEFGVEDDTGLFKIGRGGSAWNDLLYPVGGSGMTQTDADARYVKLTDAATDFATFAQGAKADTALQDAPSDGNQYARKNGAWAVVTGESSGSATWGAITGTLSTQVDLQNALNAKASLSVLSAVATSGAYSDLIGLPALGTAAAMASTAFATAAQGVLAGTAVQPGSLATVATTGAYSDLSGKPAIPAAQVNSDWSAISGVAQVLNKPTLGTAAAQDSTAFASSAQGAKADSAIQSVVAGANVTVDNTDPLHPVIASTAAGGGGGSVTSVSVVTANGVSGSVASATTTPAITLSLGAITPTSVTASGTVSGSNLSGTNTGDQTSVTGNAGTATKLATARTIALGGLLGGSASFDGSGNVTITATLADGALSIAKTSGLQSALDAKAAKATTLAGYGITDAATSAQGAKADTAVQPGALATVATSGSYPDLINKPTIPAAQVNSDWNASTGVAQILNKPTLFSGAYADLSGKPTLGTAAATDATAYATAAQGTKADSAVQPAALATVQQTIPATVVTANYTLSNADAGTEVQVNSAVAVTITVPSTGVNFSNVVLVRQIGAGQVTISGSTVKSFAATTKLAGQNALASVRFDSASAVYVSGELAAS